MSKYYDYNYASTTVPSSIDKDNIYFNIIEKIVKFPIDMLDGLLNPSFIRENINRNKDFIDFAELIFNNVYVVNNTGGTDPAFATISKENFTQAAQDYLANSFDILAGTTDGTTLLTEILTDELDELITLYSEKLIEVLGSLESIFSAEPFMQIVFSLKENEQKTLGFVEEAIKIFLSYTSQLYSSVFVREYKTVSESPVLSEKIKHKLEQKRADLVFYDEKLEIKEV